MRERASCARKSAILRSPSVSFNYSGLRVTGRWNCTMLWDEMARPVSCTVRRKLDLGFNTAAGCRFVLTRWWSKMDSNCRFRLFKRDVPASCLFRFLR